MPRWAETTFFSAAFRYHFAASSYDCTVPFPSSKKVPSLNPAHLSPCSADFLYRSNASSYDYSTPSPCSYMSASSLWPQELPLSAAMR